MFEPKREKNEEKILLSYIPHGIDHNKWKKLSEESDLKAIADLKTKFFGDDLVKFVVFYNSRNIRRKMTSDIILAYRKFLLELPVEKQNECRLLLHTAPIDENGTDLNAVLRDVAPEIKVIFSSDKSASGHNGTNL